MKTYAITIKDTNEFYPDPARTSFAETLSKVQYLISYRTKNAMPAVEYEVEELTTERAEQHKKEWNRYVSMLD